MNPLAVEQQYQRLQQSLPLMASRRGRLLQLVQFFEILCTDEQKTPLRAYAPELIPVFLRDLLSVNLSGSPRSFILRLRRLLELLRRRIPAAAEESDWTTAEASLVKEEERIAEAIRQKESDDSIGGIHDRLVAAERADYHVTIPVVEREVLLRDLEPAFAALRHIRVELSFSQREQGEDEILVDQVYDLDGAQHRQMRLALSIARRFLKTYAGISDSRILILHCAFDEPNIVVGESLGAALTFAVFTELLRLYEYREAIALRSDVVLTGVIDADGRVVPVEERGLHLKVQASAASWMRYLVVPREQENEARRALEEYCRNEQMTVPLKIVGILTLEELLFDRRLTTVRRMSLPRYAFGRMWRHRRIVVIVGSVLAVVVMLRLWYGPLDRNPALVEYRQESLVVQNSGGEMLYQLPVGGEITAGNAEAILEDRSARLSTIADVDHDGLNELIYIRKIREDGGWTEVCLRRSDQSDPTWIYRIPIRLTFGNASEATEFRFIPRGILVEDLDGNGIIEVCLYASLSNFYPSVLVVLDAVSGSEIARYLHLGGITDIAITDVEGDSRKELVACGINNAFRSAFIAVFELPDIKGASPSSQELFPKEHQTGDEKCYLLIPRSLAGLAFRTHTFGNMAFRLSSTREGRLVVGVKDFEEYVPELGEKVQGILTMTLHSDLTVGRVEVSEAYALTSEILLRKGRIDMIPDDSYFREYTKGIRYKNGSNWSSKPPERARSLNRSPQ